MARDEFAEFARAEAARKIAGQVDGRHFSSYAPEVDALLRAGDDDAAAGLLLRLIDAVEREGRIPLAGSTGVPTWYSDRLAAIYERHGKAEERALLVHRMTVLDIRVQTEGAKAKLKLDAQAARGAGRPPRRRTPTSSPRVQTWLWAAGALLLFSMLGRGCGA